MRAVIMAGGEGTRLRPFTNTIPKPLLPIGRKPVAQIIVERLRDCGITDAIMSLEYGADLIRAYFQDGAQFGVSISYFQESRKMGTAGCLAHIPELRDDAFLVTNGDVLTDLDYRELLEGHAKSGAALTVATRVNELVLPYGVLKLDGEVVREVEEKPRYEFCINAGIYALSSLAVEHVPPDREFDMTDLISALVKAGQKVRVHPITGYWFDLAKVDDFEKAVAELARAHPELL
jgi:NDP-sugar pyrophosphorylase family protein